MKRIKQGLSILIMFLMVVSSAGFVYSADYEEHWASESIIGLLNAGVLSGDIDGSIRPDDRILRAEFVKIVNKAFGYKGEGIENFSDVDSGAWYAKDFLIARSNGYIVGDQNGNARPEENVSRNEVCVILARILSLPAGGILNFADKDKIPDWAAEHVSALVSAGYISGYEDLTFRGDVYASRAEGFHIVKKIMDRSKASEESSGEASANEMGDVSGMTSTPNVSSGGSGGKTPSGTNTESIAIPIVRSFDKSTNTFSWEKISNAASYEIKIEYQGGGPVTIPVSASKTSAVISDELNQIYRLVSDPEFTVRIYIRAIGSSGKASSYSPETIHKQTFESLSVPEAEYFAGTANGIRHAKITWDEVENAGSYEAELYVDNIKITSDSFFTADSPSKTARIKDLAIAENVSAVVKIRAISAELAQYKNSPYTEVAVTIPELEIYDADPNGPVSQTGSGTKEDPYTVSSAEQFDAIRDNPTACYKLIRSIDLTDLDETYEPFLFSGSLKTDGAYRSIYVEIDRKGKGNNTGLFTQLGGSAYVNKIILKGSIAGDGYTGSFAGGFLSASGAVIEDCVNMADITGTDRVGGFMGYPYSTSSSLIRCINFGSVTGTGNVGGIAGYTYGIKISYCQNHGAVKGGGSNVGGLTGASQSNHIYSFNTGTVTSASGGGLIGLHNTISGAPTEIIGCYNLGAIDATASAYGLVVSFNPAANTTMENCYDASTLNGKTGNYACFNYTHVNTPLALTKVENVLHIDGNGTGNAVAKAITAAELKNRENEYVKKLLKGGFTFIDEYDYPVIEENLPKTKNDFYDYNPVSNLQASVVGNELCVNWTMPQDDANIEEVKLTITNNSELETVLDEISVSGNSYTLPEQNLENGDFYGIKITIVYKNGGKSGTAKTEALYTAGL